MKNMFVVAFIFVFVLILLPQASYAQPHPLREILGVSTGVALPPTIDGPGFVLPHSNLYFIDKIKQRFLLSLSFSQSAKISMFNAIAGERLAELKIEIEDQNLQGIDTALAELTSTISEARQEIESYSRKGKLDPKVARLLNDAIKERYAYLATVDSQVTGSLLSKIKAAKRSLLEDKVKLASLLPADIAESEGKSDLKLALDESLADVSASAMILQKTYIAQNNLVEKSVSGNKVKGAKTSSKESEFISEIEKIVNGVQGIIINLGEIANNQTSSSAASEN